jgi:bacterial translation initiation factor 2 (bIF-2)
LVEEWGGKIQSQDISAKTGMGVEDLLEKVMLEAELLELKANPEKYCRWYRSRSIFGQRTWVCIYDSSARWYT